MKHKKKKKGEIHNNIFTTPTFKEGTHGKNQIHIMKTLPDKTILLAAFLF